MINELTDYLEQEAARVRVDDTLADIHTGITLVPVARPRRRQRWATPALVGAAAAAVVALIGITATTRPATSTVTPAVSVGGQPGESAAPLLSIDATEPASTIVTPVPVPLPAGATMQGFTPLCTTTNAIDYDCTVDGYRHAGGYDDGGFDHTGEVQAVITAGSIVSGGCRSTSADGSTWHCVLGQRAVDLDMIAPNYLGRSEAPGYAAG
jgi:hypothetical protein